MATASMFALCRVNGQYPTTTFCAVTESAARMPKPRATPSEAGADRLQDFRELVALNKEAEDQCKRLKDKMLAMSKSMPGKTMSRYVDMSVFEILAFGAC